MLFINITTYLVYITIDEFGVQQSFDLSSSALTVNDDTQTAHQMLIFTFSFLFMFSLCSIWFKKLYRFRDVWIIIDRNAYPETQHT